MADYNDFLTPYQRDLESVGLGARGFNEDVRSSGSRALPNPFIENDGGLTGVATPPSSAVPSATGTAVPNRLVTVKSPFPVATMPVAQQIAWAELANKQTANEAALEAQLLSTEVAKTESENKREAIRQGREFMAELPMLSKAFDKGGSYEDYPVLKAELQRKFPAAAGSIELDRALGTLDQRYAKLSAVEEDIRKTKIAREDAAKQERRAAGYKEAEKLGQDVVAKYAALIDEKPDEAFAELATAQNANVYAQLKASGKTEQEIAQAYGGGSTGRPLDYAAALADQKTRAAVAQENARATADFVVLDKLRVASGFDPADAKQLDAQGKPKDPFAQSEGWTPDMEAAWASRRDYMISLTPKVSGNRGGVAGMPGALGGTSLYRDYQPVAAQPALGPAASQTAPQRVPVTQQAAEPAGATKVINNVPVVKGADGKWYKVKQR